jgi:hypothetical protein
LFFKCFAFVFEQEQEQLGYPCENMDFVQDRRWICLFQVKLHNFNILYQRLQLRVTSFEHLKNIFGLSLDLNEVNIITPTLSGCIVSLHIFQQLKDSYFIVLRNFIH